MNSDRHWYRRSALVKVNWDRQWHRPQQWNGCVSNWKCALIGLLLEILKIFMSFTSYHCNVAYLTGPGFRRRFKPEFNERDGDRRVRDAGKATSIPAPTKSNVKSKWWDRRWNDWSWSRRVRCPPSRLFRSPWFYIRSTLPLKLLVARHRRQLTTFSYPFKSHDATGSRQKLTILRETKVCTKIFMNL